MRACAHVRVSRRLSKEKRLYTVTDLFDLSHTQASEYLKQFIYPWQAVAGIGSFIAKLSCELGDDYVQIAKNVWAHKSAKIAPSAYLGEWTIIGAETEVRHCAFIRGNALVGSGCVVGNSTELKNVILFDGVQVPHYNYVGDSVLGYKAHMGAGAITSNVKSDKTLVTVNGEEKINTGLKKLGAMLGDFVEVGCNSVLNPGTVIGKRSIVYPLTSVRGVIPSDSVVKSGSFQVTQKRKG